MKFLVILTLMLSIVTGCAQHAQLSYSKLMNETGYIIVYETDLNNTPVKLVTGAGVFIRHKNDCYMLTVAHVVRSAETKPPSKPRCILVSLPNNSFLSAEIAVISQTTDEQDLALLKIQDIYTGEAISGIESKIQIGQHVTHVGHPHAYYKWAMMDGKVLWLPDYKAATDQVLMDIPAKPGCSGGGVFDDDGKLVGLMCATMDELSLMVDAKEIHKWAIKYRVEFIFSADAQR